MFMQAHDDLGCVAHIAASAFLLFEPSVFFLARLLSDFLVTPTVDVDDFLQFFDYSGR